MKTMLLLLSLIPFLVQAQTSQPGRTVLNGCLKKSLSIVSSDTSDLYWDDKFGPTGLGGEDCMVYASVADGLNLYIGGTFLYAGEKTVNHIARWNGSEWETLGAGTNGAINAIAIHGGKYMPVVSLPRLEELKQIILPCGTVRNGSHWVRGSPARHPGRQESMPWFL